MLAPKHLYHVVSHANGVEILDVSIVLGSHKSIKLRVKGKHSDADSLTFQHDIWLDKTVKGRTPEVVIGANNGEVCLLEETNHVVDAVVELVVSDGACVIMHAVHQANLDVSLEECIIR